MSVRATAGKRVSFVELYFDLVFVFAMGQTAHALVAVPTVRGLGVAFGLFIMLWWSWIGFTVLYNRWGAEQPRHRLIVLAGTVPCALAAVAVHAAVEGHTAGFALALAAARGVLGFAYAFSAGRSEAAHRRISVHYAVSLVLLLLSTLTPAPWRYLLWGAALVQEAGALLGGEPLRRGRLGPFRRRRAPAQPAPAPDDRALRVDAAHLAERFGLFMIILLGEIVITVGNAALDLQARSPRVWLGLLAGLVLAAALWWIYFTSAAEIDEFVLHASGGHPGTAYGLYAGGQLGPSFALLVLAAGISLALGSDPPPAAGWLITVGVAGFLAGTRVVAAATARRFGRLFHVAGILGVVFLALLQQWITATGVLVGATAWTAAVAAVVSAQHPHLLRRLAAEPIRSGTRTHRI